MSPKYLIITGTVAMASAWTIATSRAPVSPAYVARMTGAQETPAIGTAATGVATFTIVGTKLHYVVRVNRLSGAPTAAHIHRGAAGVAGPPIYTFALKSRAGRNGAISEGMFDLTTNASTGVTGDSLKVLLANGNAYVNVHTAKYPGGETRGQVVEKH